MISAMASSPALASCSRTPPVSNRIRTGIGPKVARGPQEPHELRPVDLADGAAHEPALLRGDPDKGGRRAGRVRPIDAIVELLRQIEDGEMRAGLPLLRPDELGETSGIEQKLDAPARRKLVPAGRSRSDVGHGPPSSIEADRLGKAQRHRVGPSAPIVDRKLEAARRPARDEIRDDRLPDATETLRGGLDGDLAGIPGSRRSTRTSRLPEATTPTIASALVPPARWSASCR